MNGTEFFMNGTESLTNGTECFMNFGAKNFLKSSVPNQKPNKSASKQYINSNHLAYSADLAPKFCQKAESEDGVRLMTQKAESD